VILGQVYEFFAFVDSQSQRLFDKNVFAGENGPFRQRIVLYGGRSDCHCPYAGHSQHLLEVGSGLNAISGAKRFESIALGVANGSEHTEFVEIANQILSPIATTDDTKEARLKLHGHTLPTRHAFLFDLPNVSDITGVLRLSSERLTAKRFIFCGSCVTQLGCDA